MNKIILQGDCIERLKELQDQSVHCCVTSPPYWGLRDYGVEGQIGLEPSPEAFVGKMVEVFREVRRVLRDDGTLWLNLGDSYAGQPRRDEGLNERWHGKHYLSDKQGETARARPERKMPTNLKPKDLVGIPWRVAFALQADGWYLRSDIIWSKPNPMPESVTDRPTKAHEYIFLLSKSERYYYDAAAIKEPGVQNEWANGFRGGSYTENKTYNNSEGGNRTNRGNIKVPSGWDTEPGAHGKIHRNGRANSFARKVNESPQPGKLPQHREDREPVEYDGMRNKRTVWTVATKAFSEAHFATFPPKLIEPCILAGCPVGGTVLDPFNGAGTTGLVALQNNREYIGIELNPEYIKISEKRLSAIQPKLIL